MRLARRSELVAVASRDRARAEAYAREWSIPRAVVGYQTLLDDPSIDAVYIPLPNTDHVPWTLAAIAAGKHVLCEKPLALDPADVDRIAAAAAAAARRRRRRLHVPPRAADRARDVARQRRRDRHGSRGRVRLHLRARAGAEHPPRSARSAAGRCGMSAAIRSRTRSSSPATSRRWCSARRTGTRRASTKSSWACCDSAAAPLPTSTPGFRAAYRTWLEVLGSDGGLTVPNPFRPGPLETLELERNGAVEHIDVVGSPEIFVREIEDFEASVLDGAPPVVSLAESRRTAATLAALHAAARGQACAGR